MEFQCPAVFCVSAPNTLRGWNQRLQLEKVKNAEAHIGKIASLDSVMRTTTVSLFHKNMARSATWKCWLIRHSEMR